MDPLLGQIILFAGTYAPAGWAFCEGQILSIMENTALFSILGTTYGGNGNRTFALPDLRGRVPVGAGVGPSGPIAAGDTGDQNASGSGGLRQLGMRYIIALQGIYPCRD
jgi:microcystin-dependent protein